MSAVEAYLWAALGISLSVLIPVVTRAVSLKLPSESTGLLSVPRGQTWFASVRAFAGTYLLVAVLSLMVAVLLVAFVDFSDWRAALLGGYAWDATLQKVRSGTAPRPLGSQ